MLPREVFSSHSSRDAETALRIVRLLGQHEVPAFYSPHNILGAQQWHDEIGDALARCDWFLLLLSPDAVTSKWVKRELMYALRSDHYDRKIVPIVYRDCDYNFLSWTLAELQMVDFRDYDDGARNLLRIWGLDLKIGKNPDEPAESANPDRG